MESESRRRRRRKQVILTDEWENIVSMSQVRGEEKSGLDPVTATSSESLMFTMFYGQMRLQHH